MQLPLLEGYALNGIYLAILWVVADASNWKSACFASHVSLAGIIVGLRAATGTITVYHLAVSMLTQWFVGCCKDSLACLLPRASAFFEQGLLRVDA